MLQGERAALRAWTALAGLALATCLLAAGPSRAEEGRWLRWSAPAECQNTGEVERRVQSLLGRPVDFGAVPQTLVRMGWSAERGWAVRVTVELAGGPRDRSLDAPSCADAFDVIALSLALILDPDFGSTDATPPESEAGVGATPAEGAPGSTPDAAPSHALRASAPNGVALDGLTGADVPGVRGDVPLASEGSARSCAAHFGSRVTSMPRS